MPDPANLEPTAAPVMLWAALARVPRYTGNVNVLLHTPGYFSGRISDEERAYCIRPSKRYRNGHATLSEPRNLLRSWVIRFQEPYQTNQAFFAPCPAELVDLPGEITDRGRDVWNTGEDSPA
ncbi:MAG: YbgA family protein [Methanoculleus sp.]|jgi:uncharacterized protein YbgA (DUF1722 family)|nr:YbgA family protein [Methanoculleus sp.]